MQTRKRREAPPTDPGLDAPKVYPRRSIYMGMMLTRMLEGSRNSSARLENMSRRLSLLTSLAAPQLTAGEWAVVVLALSGGVGIDDLHAAERVLAWAHVYGEGAEETYGVDAVELARSLTSQGGLANVVIAEIAERYWQFGPEVDHAERLELMRLLNREQAVEWKNDGARRSNSIREGALRSLQAIA